MRRVDEPDTATLARPMGKSIPSATIRTLAKTIHREARDYGFSELDFIRLVNAILDLPGDAAPAPADAASIPAERGATKVDSFPLRAENLEIRRADAAADADLLANWLGDEYGRHFLLSSSTAQSADPESLLANPNNEVGIVMHEAAPIGAVAYLDIDPVQRRAELRKLIGERSARGRGFAEEATRLWIDYGGERLGLEKVFVSTLQTHLRNIQLNEAIGFRVEGVLHREMLIEGERYDVLRMGLCYDEYRLLRPAP